MTAHVEAGWLTVPYAGHDLAKVEIATGDRHPGLWRPAFLDWHDGQRVAKIRPPWPVGHSVQVWLRVDGHTQLAGRVAP